MLGAYNCLDLTSKGRNETGPSFDLPTGYGTTTSTPRRKGRAPTRAMVRRSIMPGRNRLKEPAMCPACIATVALIAASATSTGGLTPFVVKKLRAETGAKDIAPTTRTRGEQDESCESRVTS